jgi:hypothetical protein
MSADLISIKLWGLELAGSGTLGVVSVVLALVIVVLFFKPRRGRL